MHWERGGDMAYHFMVIMSHYGKGYRIGWHYSSEGKLDKSIINDFMKKLKDNCGDVQFGVHKLSTDSTDLKSVKAKDEFFEDVIFISDMDTFIELVASDRQLSAYDVSKFILTILPSSHLKLQKILYYCYAEFLTRTGLKLFNEPIVSYKYGPVVEEVFRKFRSYGSSIIDYQEDDKFIILPNNTATTPSFIKMITSKQGLVAADSVLNVLKKYGNKKPFELVEMTHRKGGPWDRVYKQGYNQPITDELIIEHHHKTQ